MIPSQSNPWNVNPTIESTAHATSRMMSTVHMFATVRPTCLVPGPARSARSFLGLGRPVRTKSDTLPAPDRRPPGRGCQDLRPTRGVSVILNSPSRKDLS